MEFDKLREVWKSQEGAPRLTVEPETLLKETQRNKRYFEAKVFWRDLREVGLSILMALIFTCWCAKTGGWPWGVLAASCLFVAGFMLVDRTIQRKKRPTYSDTLRQCAEEFLREVNHQIWLLRSLFWWYLLPLAAGLAIFLAYCTWSLQGLWWLRLISAFVAFGIVAALYYGIYRLNQSVVQKVLEPRSAELKALIESLKGEGQRR